MHGRVIDMFFLSFTIFKKKKSQYTLRALILCNSYKSMIRIVANFIDIVNVTHYIKSSLALLAFIKFFFFTMCNALLLFSWRTLLNFFAKNVMFSLWGRNGKWLGFFQNRTWQHSTKACSYVSRLFPLRRRGMDVRMTQIFLYSTLEFFYFFCIISLSLSLSYGYTFLNFLSAGIPDLVIMVEYF